jgi:hypothetical protein
MKAIRLPWWITRPPKTSRYQAIICSMRVVLTTQYARKSGARLLCGAGGRSCEVPSLNSELRRQIHYFTKELHEHVLGQSTAGDPQER